MKRLDILLIAVFVFMLTVLPAYAETTKTRAELGETKEADIMASIFAYCMPSVLGKKDSAWMIEKGKLKELPKDQAAAFSQKGGRAFAPKKQADHLTLVAEPGLECRGDLRNVNVDDMWGVIDVVVGTTGDSPFVLESREKKGDATIAIYDAKNTPTGTPLERYQGMKVVAWIEQKPGEKQGRGAITFMRPGETVEAKP